MCRHSGSDRALAGLTYLHRSTHDNIRGDGRLRERFRKATHYLIGRLGTYKDRHAVALENRTVSPPNFERCERQTTNEVGLAASARCPVWPRLRSC